VGALAEPIGLRAQRRALRQGRFGCRESGPAESGPKTALKNIFCSAKTRSLLEIFPYFCAAQVREKAVIFPV
jgi:hypothetical protein